MELRRPFTQDESTYKTLTETLLERLSNTPRSQFRQIPGTEKPPLETLPVSNGNNVGGFGFTFSPPASLPEGSFKKPDPSTPRKAPNGVEKSERTTLAKDDDDFKSELRILANVLTYFDYAWKRTFDVIPMLVEQEFFIAFSNELRDTLTQELGLNGEDGVDKCNKYAAENPEIAIRREDIERRMNILVSATDILSQW